MFVSSYFFALFLCVVIHQIFSLLVSMNSFSHNIFQSFSIFINANIIIFWLTHTEGCTIGRAFRFFLISGGEMDIFGNIFCYMFWYVFLDGRDTF